VFAATPLRDRLDLGIVVLYAQAAIRFRLRPRGAGAFAANRLVAEAQNDCGKKMDTHRTKHEIMIERQRRILTVLMNLGREIRWLVSRDARVRGKGRTTVGWIIGMASKHHPSDSRSWDTYFIEYEFRIDGRRHTREQKVKDHFGCRRDMPILVHYLPEHFPPKSAIAGKPVELTKREVASEEASHAILLADGERATAVVLGIKRQRSNDGQTRFGITYEFADADGTSWGNTSWIDDLAGLTAGSQVSVLFLPERPEKNQPELVVEDGT